MLKDILRSIGLTENEAKAYIAMIEIGESTVSEITNKSMINSGRIYEILQSLVNKGFASEIIKNKIKYFSPTDTSKIRSYFEKKEKEYKSNKDLFLEILPEISDKIKSRKKSPYVEIYTGIEGLKNAYIKEANIYSNNCEVLVMGLQPPNYYGEDLMSFFEYSIYSLRERKKVKVRKIYSEDARGKTSKFEPSASIKYLSHIGVTSINVCKHLVIIGIFQKGGGIFIVIEDNETAESFRKQFEFLWKIAKK